MAILHVKTPNGDQAEVDINKIFTTDGGTLHGCIQGNVPNNVFSISNMVESEALALYGYNGSVNYGAALALYSQACDRSPGRFVLSATDADGNMGVLTGKPDGSLTWDGKEIDSLVEYDYNSNGTYFRYKTGLQVCYDNRQMTNTGYTWTFPKPFLSGSLPVIQVSSSYNGGSTWNDTTVTRLVCWVGNYSNTNAVIHSNPNATNNIYKMILAIGVWK